MSVSKYNFCLPLQILYSAFQKIEFGEVNRYGSSLERARPYVVVALM